VRRRIALLAVAALVVAVVLVFVGRWERQHRADDQNRGMRRVARAIGPLDQRSLDAFRHLGEFDCLLYKRGKNPFALELCVDHSGRVVETIDRRGSTPKIWSLRDDPARATIRVDYAEFQRLYAREVAAP
jgi:hypothetical protein